MIRLSIIIVSYNTKEILERCLQSLIENISKYSFKSEIIVVDNASIDDSQSQISRLRQGYNGQVKLKTIFNKKNIGFGKANNQGVKIAEGEFILFLNSDVVVDNINFDRILKYFESDKKNGVLTTRVVLGNGIIDPACHRGFPTPWRAFCYFFALEAITKNIPWINIIFGGYHLTHLDLNTVHEIDSPSGAFYLTKKELFEKVGGFDEEFFMYGEDLDLSYRIKQRGFKVIYFPMERVIHYKYQSGLGKSDIKIKSKTKNYFFDAMKIFYKKHYEQRYPKFFSKFIYLIINKKNNEKSRN